MRRSLESLPRIITSSQEDGPQFTFPVPTYPLLLIHSPSESGQENLSNEMNATKDSNSMDLADDVEGEPGSSLDPNSIPLRVIYSPSVSRSGSVGQSDRPSIVVSHENESCSDIPTLSPEDDSAQVRSFQPAAYSDSHVHRRSRNNSYSSYVETRPPSSPTSSAVRRSFSPARRLAFEESGNRDRIHAPSVFVAFPRTKWLRPILAAKIILGFVCCAVLGNLIYTWVSVAKLMPMLIMKLQNHPNNGGRLGHFILIINSQQYVMCSALKKVVLFLFLPGAMSL